MTNKQHLYFLDGWRGIAVLIIVFGHITNFYNINLIGADNSQWLIVQIVDVFFIISGFLISKKLFSREPVGITSFLINRASRILPQYAAVVVAALLLNQIAPPFSVEKKSTLQRPYTVTRIYNDKYIVLESEDGRVIYTVRGDKEVVNIGDRIKISETLTGSKPGQNPNSSIVPYLLFVQNYFRSKAIPALNHTWFVSIIVHFYIIIALLIFISGKIMADFKRRNLLISLLLLAAVILLNILRYKIVIMGGDMYYQKTHFRIDVVLLGCLLYFFTQFLSEKGPVLKKYLFQSIFLFSGVGLLAFQFLLPKYPLYQMGSPIFFTVSSISFALMILGSYKKTAFSTFLFENPVFRWLGKNSYGIYLWHYPLMYYFYFATKDIQLGVETSAAGCIIISIITGAISEKLLGGKSQKTLSLPPSK